MSKPNKPAEPPPEVAPMQEPTCVVCGIAKSKAHNFCAASNGPEGFDDHVFRVPAVAPRETQTAVEPKVDVWRGSWARPKPGTRRDIIGVHDLPDGRTEYLMHNEGLCRPYYLAVSAPPAAPAESQGVERAQPVESCRHDFGPTYDQIENRTGDAMDDDPAPFDTMDWGDGKAEPLAAPVEGVERVTTPAQVACPSCNTSMVRTCFDNYERREPGWVCPSCDNYQPDEQPGEFLARARATQPVERVTDDWTPQFDRLNQIRRLMAERDLLLASIAPADYVKIQAQLIAISESPDEHTDDRLAETIPDDLRDYYADIKRRSNGYRSAEMEIVERTGRAETRIEVLEAALRAIVEESHNDKRRTDEVLYNCRELARAALAAPSGETKA